MNGRRVKALRNQLFVDLTYKKEEDGDKRSYMDNLDFKKLFRAKKNNYRLNQQPWHSAPVEFEESKRRGLVGVYHNSLKQYFRSARKQLKSLSHGKASKN